MHRPVPAADRELARVRDRAQQPLARMAHRGLDRAELARQLALSVDTLQRWETRRVGPPCVRVGRKVLYRKEAVRDWLKEQEARKTGQHKAVAGRR